MAEGNPLANGHGLGLGHGEAPELLLPRIREALQLVHNPYTANEARQQAQAFLEHVKTLAEAPLRGFELASDRANNSFVVRHYALSLLENAIKHHWADYSSEQSLALRQWVTALCRNVDPADPAYLRGKTAQLWVEVAKRCWAAPSAWMDMDDELVALWLVPDSPPQHKELVLSVLESLSDDVFAGEDSVVAMRESVLSKACVEIFTPEADLVDAFPNRQSFAAIRCGDEGWLRRICHLLVQCFASASDIVASPDVRAVVLRALTVISSVASWIIPRAVVSTGCIDVLTTALASPHVAVQKASLEALHILYSRTSYSDRELADVVLPMFRPPIIDLYQRLVKWSTVDANDIDDDKYQFSKKFSEMLSCLGNCLDRRSHQLVGTDADVDGFLDVMLRVAQSESAVVSIPMLVTWNRLLAGRSNTTTTTTTTTTATTATTATTTVASAPDLARFMAPLLELCSARMIRYEYLPADTTDPTYLFLMEDTDTVPERHAFLGNYRRYATGIIQAIAQIELAEVLHHILAKTEDVLATVANGQFVPSKDPYPKHSLQVLRVDAQLSVLEAAVKGFVKWRKAAQDKSPVQNADSNGRRAAIEQTLATWGNSLLEKSFDDPQIRKRVLQLLVFFSTTALDRNAPFMLKVLEHILMTWPASEPQYRDYNECIKELQSESTVELQRLALEMPDHLLNVYDQIEARVREMIASGTLDDKRAVAYRSFLFIIIHRATSLAPTVKVERLIPFVEPVLADWQRASMKQSLSSFAGYCELLGLDRAQHYLVSRNVHQVADWGAVDLDAEGLALQAELEARIKVLPLRATKSLLMDSVERLDRSSETFQVSQALWEEGLPVILSDLLQILSHAHASHNPSSWTGIPPELRPTIVGRVLSDRFWHAGISDGSKDDFYARVVEKKGTLEGLASTIRGSIRFVRETSYALLCCMSRFDVLFYGFSELPDPLSRALFTNAAHLSTHQLTNLLHLVKYLTDDVPPELRVAFLPAILGGCFRQMDAKIKAEWDRIDHRQANKSADDDLQDEMKTESILRQVSHTAVLMVAEFLDPTKSNPPPLHTRRAMLPPELANDTRSYPTLRRMCLLRSEIIGPLMMFAANTIRIRDQRSCSIIIRVVRSIIAEFVPPEFDRTGASGRPPSSSRSSTASDSDSEPLSVAAAARTWPIPPDLATDIREFMSSEVVRACVASFHDPAFVDLQKELALLIAQIIVYYGRTTDTGRRLLLSLPGVREQDLNRLADFVDKPAANTRQQRAIVLDLLKDVKAVSVSEMGKIRKSGGISAAAAVNGSGNGTPENGTPNIINNNNTKMAGPSSGKRSDRSKMAQQFMEQPAPGGEVVNGVGVHRTATMGMDGLEDIAVLFDS